MATNGSSRFHRDLGEAEAHQQEALRQIDRMGRHRRKEPSLPDTKLDAEDSKVIRDAVRQGVGDALAEGLRAASVEHKDSSPPSSRSGLSIRLPWNIGVHAHGRVVWLVALLAFVLALAWLATRAKPATPTPVVPAPTTIKAA